GVFQRRRDLGAIVNRIGERCDILVSGIAQHQRYALLGKGRPADQEGGGRRQHQSNQSQKSRFHNDASGASHFLLHHPAYQKAQPGFVSYVTNHAHVNRSLASSLVGPAPWWFGPWPISFPAGFPRTDIDPGGEQFRTTEGFKRRAPARK